MNWCRISAINSITTPHKYLVESSWFPSVNLEEQKSGSAFKQETTPCFALNLFELKVPQADIRSQHCFRNQFPIEIIQMKCNSTQLTDCCRKWQQSVFGRDTLCCWRNSTKIRTQSFGHFPYNLLDK